MFDKIFLSSAIILIVAGQLGRISLQFLPFEFYLLDLVVLLHVLWVTVRHLKYPAHSALYFKLQLANFGFWTNSWRRLPAEVGLAEKCRGIFDHKNIPGSPKTKRAEDVICPITAKCVCPTRPELHSLLTRSSFKPICIFAIYLLLCWLVFALNSSFLGNIVSLGYITRSILLLLYFVLTQRHVSKHLDTALSIIPALCVLQFFLLPDLRFLSSLGWDPHMYRAVGLYLDPPITSSILILISLYFIYIKKPLTHILLTMLAITLLFARSGYIVYLSSITVLYIVCKQYRHAIILPILFILCVLVAPSLIPKNFELESTKIARTSTISSRKTELLAGYKTFATHPIFGIGWGRVAEYKSLHTKPAYSDNHASSAYHSFWLTMLATSGVVGFFLFINIWRPILLGKKPIFWLLFASIAAIGMLENTFLHPLVFVTFTLVFAHLQTSHYT